MHPGADSVKRPRQDSRIRIVYVTDSKVKDVDSFIRVEPRIQLRLFVGGEVFLYRKDSNVF